MLEGRNFRKVLWGQHPNYQHLNILTNWTWNLLALSSSVFSYLNYYVNKLVLPFSSVTSIIGFMLLIAIVMQLLSGFFLAWYFIPEPGFVIELREEMFNETRYGIEVFSMHVRGVDVIMVLSYMHILKKIFLKNYINTESDGWMLGGYAFFWFHYVVGLGICLSASHLSDLTLTIIANIFWSLFNNIYKTYYVIFTNKHLNVDQLTRLMLFHYFTPWYYLFLVKLHVMFCHESWDTDSGENFYEDRSGVFISWFWDAFLKEIQDAWHWTLYLFVYFAYHHMTAVSLSYFFFERWNIVELDDIRFYGVAPHWYFRPLMGLLVISPTHLEGLMWMGLFFILLAGTPILYGIYNVGEKSLFVTPMQNSVFQTAAFITFMMSLFCSASMLPCGRYYYEPEGGYVGNPWVKFSYQYIYFYLGWLVHHLDLIDNFVYRVRHQMLEEMTRKDKSIYASSLDKYTNLKVKDKPFYPHVVKKAWFTHLY